MSREGMSRRQALRLVTAGLASIGVGVAGLWQRWGVADDESTLLTSTSGFREPETLFSRNGSLNLTLIAGVGRQQVAGRTVNTLGYNGSSPGPTWRIRPGDNVTVDLQNRLDAATNLHVHGMHVSPEGRSDNVFVRVDPGESFRYEYTVPATHPTGTFWYHPHVHGLVADQVSGGLAGAIVVESDLDQDLPAERERVLVISDISVNDDGSMAPVSAMDRMMGREGQYVLVNGQAQPKIAVTVGSLERWRVINTCASRFLRLHMRGAELMQIGIDGSFLSEPRDVDDVLLATGQRSDLLVRFPEAATFDLVSTPVDRGGMGMGGMMGGSRNAQDGEPVVLATVRASGTPKTAVALPTRLAALTDLRAVRVDGRRTVTFQMGMGMGGMRFTIDGSEFDHDRVDSRAAAGNVEEWTIVNDSPMDHPFHLHVWPFQIVGSSGGPLNGPPVWRDVVNVPARQWVRVRIRFDDFTGRTVYHCHILDHEDNGMMATLQVDP